MKRFPAIDPDIAKLGALLAEPSRIAMLEALLEGKPLSAGELARRARISPQTASEHLARLSAGGLLAVTTRGRWREYRFARPEVAELLESLARLAPAAEPHRAPEPSVARAIREARTCYDHLAGALGVAVTAALCMRGQLEGDIEGLRVTKMGEAWFRELGIDLEDLRAKRRPFTRACLDWSERKPHLAGALGAAMTSNWFDRGWLVRVRASRAVRLTDRGRKGLRDRLDLVISP